MKSSDIEVKYREEKIDRISLAKCNWKYGTKEYKKLDITVCPLTCRPYSICKKEKIEWREAFEKYYGMESTLCISINKYYGQYVIDNKIYPSMNQMILYLNKVYERVGTLPFHIIEMVENIEEHYRDIKNNITPEEFARRYFNSIRIITRKSMDTE